MLTYNPLMEFAVETRGLARNVRIDSAPWTASTSQVPAGSFYGFLGPNGAGKSHDDQVPDRAAAAVGGEMRILGIDPLADPVAIKRRVGVVPEDLALFDRLTAAETLSFVGAGARHRPPRRSRRARRTCCR